MDEVLAVMKEAAAQAILPRFRALSSGDIEEKSPGEVVTRADREAEAIIAPVLRRLRPEAIFVGEEATTANPALLYAIDSSVTAWLVDPLDGTSNFVAGEDQFAVMVALVERGVTTQAWIWRPVQEQAWVAQLGAGVTRNDERVRATAGPRAASELRGAVRLRFLDEEHRVFAQAGSGAFREILPGTGSAGVDYPAVVAGDQDFVLYRRTLPWDHAPGALILQEAGGVAKRWDGSDYAPGDGKEGLIAADGLETWAAVESRLLQPRHRLN